MSARWRLVLARHGQTPANVAQSLDTRLPGPGLTGLGRQQAAALGRDLDDGLEGPVTAVYHSHATRAVETAAIVAEALALTPQPLDGTHEVQAGALESRSDDDAISVFRSTFASWQHGDLDAQIPGGESGHEVLDRMLRAVATLRARHPEGATPVLVSHGAALRLLATALVGADEAPAPEEDHLANCARVVVERPVTSTGDGDRAGWELVAWRHEVPGGLPSTQDATGEATREVREQGGRRAGA